MIKQKLTDNNKQQMEFDPIIYIVKICINGMELEAESRYEDGGNIFLHA
jgi:hypothetical protein